MRSLITIQQRSENGYGFESPGRKTGVENGIFWSEIGSGFGEPGGTPLPRIQGFKMAHCTSNMETRLCELFIYFQQSETMYWKKLTS